MKNESLILTIVLIILAIFLLGGIFPGMMGYGRYGGMMPFYYPIYSSMWIFGWLFMILIIIALALFIFWLTKQFQDKK